MFKKVEIWILYLTVMLGFVACMAMGVLVRQELVGGLKMGRVSAFALFVAEMPSNLKKAFTHDSILEDRFPALSGFQGESDQTEKYLLLSRYDGDRKQGIVELIDLMSFEVIHSWNPDIDELNHSIEKVDEFRYLDRDVNNQRSRLVHPQLTVDGGLLFKDNSPLRKIDACSKLVFQNSEDLFHHSIEIDADNNIWTSTHLYPQHLHERSIGKIDPKSDGFLDDAIVKLSPNGEILFYKSIAELFIENEMEYLLFAVGDMAFSKDPIHVNDIQPALTDSKFWLKGDVFISLRHQSMILLYRPSSNEIIWKKTGLFFHQHDVDILDDHRISLFNNNSKNFSSGDTVDGNNEILLYDFSQDKMYNYLSESLVAEDVRTVTEGQAEILPNGDLFLEESNFGRSLYFNRDGSLKWSHVNRGMDGNVYMISWSRILYSPHDLQLVANFLKNKDECSE